MPALKRGKFSVEEERIMRENHNTMSFVDIGEIINRSPEAVQTYLVNKGFIKELTQEQKEERATLLVTLHSLPFWPSIVESYTQEEVIYFENNWIPFYKQLNEDVSYSEHMFIKDYLILELEKCRLLKKEMATLTAIKNLKQEISTELDKGPGNYDIPYVSMKQGELSQLESNIKVFIDGLEKLNKDIRYFTDKIKADRTSRREVENSADTYWGYVALLDGEEFRKEESYKAELGRIAAEKALKKLSGWHEYKDGTLDIPILNHETFDAAMEIEAAQDKEERENE